MDDETRIEFQKVNDSLIKINLGVEKNLAFQKGLDLPNRMTAAERDIEKKASWYGLYLTVGLIVGIVILALVIAKGIN